ncbi:MAG: YqhA family protein [Prevotellaceae bacterium]|nr:YqhA family protein [Prevotellaceae bacterium]
MANKVIGETEIKQLREALHADGMIDKAKANMLFELKDAFLDKNNHSTWEPFFIDSITDFLLNDEESPGEIDEKEAKWLRAKIQHDGKLGRIDKVLLTNLKRKSINFPEMLHFKNKSILFFETILFSTRFVTFLAVIGSMLAAVTLFVTSTMQVADGLVFATDIVTGKSTDLEHLIAKFVSSVDGYLFATVLLIFSMGIYELFINKIDLVNKQKDSRPNWMVINSIDDLKSSLGKVILMILIVSFFEHSLKIKYANISDLLFLGIGILLIAAALFLTHVHGKHKKN